MGVKEHSPAGGRLAPQALAPLCADFRPPPCAAERLDALIEAALGILERTGIRVLSPRALDVLARHGATVDPERQTARLAPELVLEALRSAPRTFVLGSRDGSCDLELTPARTYCANDGCAAEIVDFATGQRRASTKADVAAISRLVDHLGSLGFWWPAVSAGDRGPTAQLHELDAGWHNTRKHLMGMVQGERLARCAVEMAEAVAGSREALRRRPLLSDLVCTVSPLVVDRDGIEAALVFAEAGVPVCLCSMPVLGTTAPADLAGAAVLGLAEIAGAATIVELAFPGAPLIGAIFREWADPRTGATMQLPRDARCMSLATQLVHRLGLPYMAGYGGTDAETAATWQTGTEVTYDLAMAALDEAELMAGLGLVDTFRAFSLEKLLLDDDVYHLVRHALLDLPPGDLDAVLNVVHAVGPGGSYLGQRHTRAHLRDVTTLTIAQQHDEHGRRRDAAEVARERGLRILAEYEPAPLPDDVRSALTSILARADEDEGTR